jgi:CelD/BcsL family acetyltransferase involved in cellulose biosynthesis
MLLALSREGRLLGIAPLAYHQGVITFLGDTNLFDYQDFLVRKGDEGYFYEVLLEYLGNKSWQSLDFPSIREDSPTMSFLPDLARHHGWSVRVELQDVSPGITLTPTWEEFLNGLRKKDRHELRRKLRRLDNYGETTLYSCGDTDDLVDAATSLFTLMRDGSDAKRQFLTPRHEDFFRAIITEAAKANILKLYFLEIDGERAAAALCFDYEGTRFLYNSGFSSRYGSLSVGLLIKALSLQDAIQNQIAYYDFLRGDEAYKYHLGAKPRAIYRICITRAP